MRRTWLRFLAWLLSLPLFLVLVVGAYLYLALQESDYRALVEAAVGGVLGYRLEIRGGLDLEFSVPPTLTARDVILVDPGRQPVQTLASASRVSFTCELLPLLFKRVNLAVQADQPRVQYEIDSDGRSNWRLPTIGAKDGSLEFRLDGLELRQGRLLFRDRQLDVSLEADLNQVLLESDGDRMQGTQDIRGVYNRVQFALLGDLSLGPAPDELELDLTAKVSDPRFGEPGANPAEAQLQVTGRVRSLAAVPVLDLRVHSLFPNVGLLLRLLELDRIAELMRPGTGPVAFTAHVQGSHGQLRLDPLELRLQQSGARLDAQGSASFARGQSEIALGLQGHLEDLASSPVPLPGLPPGANGLGPVEGKARLLLDGAALALEDIELALERPELRLTAAGSASDLLGSARMRLDLNARAARLSTLPKALGMPLPAEVALGPVQGRARLVLTGPDLALEGVRLDLKRKDINLVAEGSVADLLRQPRVSLDLSSDGAAVAQLAQLPGLGFLARFDPAKVEGRVRLVYAGEELRTQRMRLTLQRPGLRLTAVGQVLGLLGDLEPDLQMSAEAKRLADLADPLGLPVPGYARMGKAGLRGRLLGAKGVYRLESARAELTQDGLALSMEGRVMGFPGQLVVEGRAKLRSDRLGGLNPMLGLELAPVGPVDLSGDLTLAAGSYEVGKLRAVVADSEVSGHVALDLRGARPYIRGSLASGRLDLDQLTGVAFRRAADTEATVQGAPDQRLFSPDPIPLDWLRRYDFDLDLDARGVTWDRRKFPKTSGRIRAERGRFRTQDLILVLGEGSLDAVLEIDAAGPGLPRFDYRWESRQVEAENLLAVAAGIVRGGKTDGYVRLEARGNSPRELAASLNGSLLLHMGPAELLESGLQGLSSAALGTILRGLLVRVPNDSTPGYTKYRCGVLGLRVNDGVASINDTLVLEAERFTVHGYGTIDLTREVVDLEVRPFSTTGLVPSVSQLIGGFRVAGSLAQPQVQLSPSGLVTGLAVDTLTGGLLVGGIVRRIQGTQSGCEATFQRLDQRSPASP